MDSDGKKSISIPQVNRTSDSRARAIFQQLGATLIQNLSGFFIKPSGDKKPEACAEASCEQRLRKLQEENRWLAGEVAALKKRGGMLLDHTPLICTLWDLDGNVLDCNQEAVNILGLKDRTEIAEKFYDWNPEDQPNGESSRAMAQRIAREVAATGYQRYEWLARDAAGQPALLETVSVLIPWDDGYRIISYTHNRSELETRRRQALEAEERARILLDSAPFGASLWRQGNDIIECNEELLRLFGLAHKSEYIDGKYDPDPEFQPDGAPSKAKRLELLHAAEETGYQRFEWMYRLPSGEPLPAEVTLVRIPWQDDWCIAAYSRDLREHMARQEAERQARILLDAMPHITFLWDEGLNLLDCNQEGLRVFGLTAIPDASTYLHQLNPPFQPDGSSSIEAITAMIRKAFATGHATCEEWIHRTASGEDLPVEKKLVRIPWKDGWRVASYNRDLRELKIKEQQRVEAEARAKVLLDTTPLGATLWDEKGGIVFCNQEILRILGAAGLSVSDYAARFYEFSPEFQPDGAPSRKKGVALMGAAFATGYEKFEWLHRTASGEPLPTEVTLVRVPWKGDWCIAAYTRDLRERLARREAEERARLLLDAMPQIVFLWDEQLNLIDCNQEGLRVFGLTAIPDLSDYARRLNPEFQPDGSPSFETMKALIRKAFASGYERCEWMHRTVSGEEVPVDKTLMRIPWKDGWRVASYNRDLREIKAQERQRLEAEEHARILLDATPLGAGLWNEEGKLLFCNQALLRMFGISDKSEYLTRSFEFHPEFQPDGTPKAAYMTERLRAAFATGYLKFEWMHRTSSGETLPTEKTMIRVPWKGGWRVAVYTRDLREAKARHEAEERGRIMLDALPDAVFLIDEERNILDHNQAFLRMFGFSEQPVRMIDFHAISPEFQPDGAPSRELALMHTRAAIETGYQKFEWMHCTASGEPLPTEITLVRVPWQGAWCTAACFRDLREIKAHEQQMREAHEHAQSLEILSQAAQMASQAKSEFLARMSHELRTPLNAVISFLGLELQKKLPVETVQRLEISLDSCCNLLHLINDILDISKIEAGRFALSDNDYRLPALLTEVISLNAFRMEGKLITFHLEVDPNLPSMLRGDDLRIKQVLTNLLSNAFKYTEKGEVRLTIGLEPEEQAAQPGSLFIRFNIQDTGQGIKAENLKQLFTSYTRFDSRTNRLIEGTGLGLAISKHLVEMMGGWMEVESTYGEGSVFSCVIPQAVVDATPLGDATVRSLTDLRDAVQHHRSKRYTLWQCAHLPYARVLVVDDVPTNLIVAQAMLERYGMTVYCASSGQEAIELVRSEKPRYNAIFMDHMMPGMDGIEALGHIRAIDTPYARAVPVIILTANVIAGNEKMFLDHGFQAFLGKPIEPAQLDDVVHKWVKDARQEARPGSPRRRRSDVLPSCGPRSIQIEDDDAHAVAGLDMREGISRFGSETVFFDVLRSYAASMPELLERMRHSTKDSLAEFTVVAHGIKGTSYSVGANAFGDMAKELEFAAKDENWSKVCEALPAFLATAEKLLRDIGVLLRERMPAAAKDNKPLKPAPDPGELAALYQASLSCAHSAMEKHLQALEGYRYDSGGELVDWLRARVDALDYDLVSQRLAEYAPQES